MIFEFLRRIRDLALPPSRFCVAVARRLYADHCLVHASALAYASLLSIVPLLALMFAVLKGLGVQERLEPLLLSRLALDPEVVARVIEYIDRTNVGTIGALGAAALVVTVISLLGTVEASLNHIWRVEHSRTLLRKTTDYVSVVLLTPLLLLAAVAITSSVQEQRLLRWVLQTEFVADALLRALRLAPMAMNAVALMILYAAMPNRRPRLVPIVIGATAAGIAWQMVQLTYVNLQIGVARYNAIYGALSQLPVTLVWLYVSWIVVLAGAEVAAVLEFGVDAREKGEASRRGVALQILLRAAERFRGPGGGVEARTLAGELGVTTAAVEQVCVLLRESGFLALLEGEKPHYVLARDPTAIDLASVGAAVDIEGVPFHADQRIHAELEGVSGRETGAWQGRSLADLLE